MQSLIDSLRSVIGQPNFYNTSGAIDYAAVMEYFVASVLLCIVVASIFKIVTRVFGK